MLPSRFGCLMCRGSASISGSSITTKFMRMPGSGLVKLKADVLQLSAVAYNPGKNYICEWKRAFCSIGGDTGCAFYSGKITPKMPFVTFD